MPDYDDFDAFEDALFDHLAEDHEDDDDLYAEEPWPLPGVDGPPPGRPAWTPIGGGADGPPAPNPRRGHTPRRGALPPLTHRVIDGRELAERANRLARTHAWIERRLAEDDEPMARRAAALGLGRDGAPFVRVTLRELAADRQRCAELEPADYEPALRGAVEARIDARDRTYRSLGLLVDDLDERGFRRLVQRLRRHLADRGIAVEDAAALLDETFDTIRWGPGVRGGWECGMHGEHHVGFLLLLAERLARGDDVPDVLEWTVDLVRTTGQELTPIAFRPDGSPVTAALRQGMVTAFGPPGSGKTTTMNSVAYGWNGPMVMTTTKPGDWDDGLIAARLALGPVYLFDLTGRAHLPHPDVRIAGWSPLHVVDDWDSACDAAAVLGTSIPQGHLSDGNFWVSCAARLLAPYCFAAAQARHPASVVGRWVDAQEEAEVMGILARAGVEEAALAFAANMRREERTRNSIYSTAELITSVFTRHSVQRVIDRGDFDVRRDLLESNGTVIVYADPTDAVQVKPLIVLFLDQIIQARKHMADEGWLGPHLLLALDEVANICPLPSLPALLAEGPGRGIAGFLCFQDIAQVHKRWPDDGKLFLTAACSRLIFPGNTNPELHGWLLNLVGEEPPVEPPPLGYAPRRDPGHGTTVPPADPPRRASDVASPGPGKVIHVGPTAEVEIVDQARCFEVTDLARAGREAATWWDPRNREVIEPTLGRE